MTNPEGGLYLPASTVYRTMRTIKRTKFRFRPFRDPQAMPPAGWCSRCGAEVYRWGKSHCRRCGGYE